MSIEGNSLYMWEGMFACGRSRNSQRYLLRGGWVSAYSAGVKSAHTSPSCDNPLAPDIQQACRASSRCVPTGAMTGPQCWALQIGRSGCKINSGWHDGTCTLSLKAADAHTAPNPGHGSTDQTGKAKTLLTLRRQQCPRLSVSSHNHERSVRLA